MKLMFNIVKPMKIRIPENKLLNTLQKKRRTKAIKEESLDAIKVKQKRALKAHAFTVKSLNATDVKVTNVSNCTKQQIYSL